MDKQACKKALSLLTASFTAELRLNTTTSIKCINVSEETIDLLVNKCKSAMKRSV